MHVLGRIVARLAIFSPHATIKLLDVAGCHATHHNLVVVRMSRFEASLVSYAMQNWWF